jgi:hypothetical protein
MRDFSPASGWGVGWETGHWRYVILHQRQSGFPAKRAMKADVQLLIQATSVRIRE